MTSIIVDDISSQLTTTSASLPSAAQSTSTSTSTAGASLNANPSRHIPVGAIIGGVVGGIVCLLLILFLPCRKRSSNMSTLPQTVATTTTSRPIPPQRLSIPPPHEIWGSGGSRNANAGTRGSFSAPTPHKRRLLSISLQFPAFANMSGSASHEPSPPKKKKKGRTNTQLHRIRESSVEELHSETGASSRENGENIQVLV